MAALKPPVQVFIVTALACYDTPSQVAEAVKEEFGLEVSRQQVSGYDPHKHQGRNLSQQWRDLFAQARKDFIAGLIDVPIAQRAYRLRVMQRIVAKAESTGNRALVLQTIEQAAKETGDYFVNRRVEAPAPTDPAPPGADYKLHLRPDEDAPANPVL